MMGASSSSKHTYGLEQNQVVSPGAAAGGVAHRQTRRLSSLGLQQVSYLIAGMDLAGVVLLSILTGISYHLVTRGIVGDLHMFIGTGVSVGALFVFFMFARGEYSASRVIDAPLHLRKTIAIWSISFLMFLTFAFSVQIAETLSRGGVFLLYSTGLAGVVASRLIAGRAVKRAVETGMLNGRRVVLIGERSVLPGTGTVEGLQKHGFQVAERYTLAVAGAPDITRRRAIVALMTELFDFVRTEPVDEVIIVAQGFEMRLIDELMLRLRDLPLPVRLLPAPELQRLLDQPLTDVGFAHAVELQRAPLAVGERAAKRVLDVSLATIGLIALTPLLMGVAMAIKLESRGPVFFRQQRVGQTGRPFRIFKFRSMKVMDDGAVVKQATRDDARITRVGRWLRATSIDELPQLLNVIKGEMSLVGPRPHALAHDNEYTRLIANYALRHHVKPGITGWAQVNGFRGETPTVDYMRRRVEFDLWYIKNWHFWLDIKVMLMTVKSVLFDKNAY